MFDPPMADPPPGSVSNGEPGRIGRRGFIGAGLAGAGVALIAPATGQAATTSSPAAAPADGATPGGAQAAATPVAHPAAAQITRLPLQSTYPHLPAIPVDVAGTI